MFVDSYKYNLECLYIYNSYENLDIESKLLLKCGKIIKSGVCYKK